MITRERTDPLVERCKDRDSVVIHYDYFEQLVELSRWALDAKDALEELRLGHEHRPKLDHIREMGDTYGWCSYCSTKVTFGDGVAESCLRSFPSEEAT